MSQKKQIEITNRKKNLLFSASSEAIEFPVW